MVHKTACLYNFDNTKFWHHFRSLLMLCTILITQNSNTISVLINVQMPAFVTPEVNLDVKLFFWLAVFFCSFCAQHTTDTISSCVLMEIPRVASEHPWMCSMCNEDDLTTISRTCESTEPSHTKHAMKHMIVSIYNALYWLLFTVWIFPWCSMLSVVVALSWCRSYEPWKAMWN